MGRVARPVVAVVIGILVLGACQREEQRPVTPATTPAPQVVDPGTLTAGDRISAPKGKVVLTMTGAIEAHNQGKKLALDLASLERMRTVRMELNEPFLKRRMTFEGVLLADLLTVAGVPETAKKVQITALDDYKVEFTMADVRDSKMLLATRADGQPMPIDKAGPIRIVFPDGSSLGRNPDLWIWSVNAMKVS